MKKFNGIEAYWLEEGLKLVLEKGMKELEAAEKTGKNPIMTAEFFEREITQVRVKIEEMTKKKK